MVLFGSALLSRFITSAAPLRHRPRLRRVTPQARLHAAITEALEPRVLLTATHLAFDTQPTDTTAGHGLGTVTVDLLDGSGNVDTGNSSLVTISIASGPDNADPLFFAVPAVQGVVTISGLSFTVAGNYQLEASQTGLTPDISHQFAINPDAATHLAITTPPGNTAAGATMGAVAVAVEDQFNNIVTSDSSTITLGIATGPGSPGFSGTTDVAAINGIATFSDLSITKAGQYTFAVSDPGLTGDTSGSFTINPATASQIVVTQGPSTTTAGLTLVTTTAAVEDPYGNIVTNSTASVSIAVDTGSGSLAGTTTVNAVSGIASFPGLSITKADDYALTVTSSGLSPDDTGSFTINPDVATHLTITQGPTQTVAGQQINDIHVEVRDQYENVVTSDASSVVIALTTGTGTLSGTKTVAASSGIATFTGLSMTAAGSKTFSISDGLLTGATTGSTTITPAAADHLVFTTGPMGTPAGQTMAGVVVSVEDTYGNIVNNDTSSITLSINTGTGTLNGTLTEAANNGVATFSTLSINQTGPFTLNAADTGITGATSSGFTIGAALPDHLTITQGPTATVAGQSISTILVEVRDMFGNVVTTDGSNITIALNTGTGTLSGTTTVAAVNGVATFSTLSMTTAGSKTFTVSDTGENGVTGDTTGSFNITPAAASQIVLGQGPSTTVAGVTLASQTVTIEDQYGNVETGDNSNIDVSIGSGPGALNGTTPVAAVNGVATFSDLNITQTGSYTLHFADGSITADTASFTITPDAPVELIFAQGPVGTNTATDLATITVDVVDQYGNIVTNNSSNVTVFVSSGAGELSGTATQAAVNGVASFTGLHLYIADDYTLSASGNLLTGDTSGIFTIAPGPATQLYIQQGPNNAVASQSLSTIIVQVLDGAGNIVTTDSSNVTIALTTGSGTLLGTKTVAAVNGVATFTGLAVRTTGQKTFTATDGTLSSDSTAAIMISPDAPSQLVFATAPSTGTVGALGNVVVDVEDQYGNIVTGDSSSVTVDINSGSGTLVGTKTIAAVNGVATLTGLEIHVADQYTLAATDSSLTAATTAAFTLSPGAGTQLVIDTQPGTDNVGNTIPSAVFVEDQYNNVVTADNSQVTVSLGSGSATINGTLTVPVINGEATFTDLFITKAGDYTFHFADGTLTTADSHSFTMNPIGPDYLLITTGPTTTVAGHTISTIVVDVLDVYGNISTGDVSDVTLSIASGPGSLAGTTTQTAVAGVATFAGLDITTSGSYTLSAGDSDNSVGGDTSGTFGITPDSPSKVVFTTGPAGGTVGNLNTIVAKVEDQYNNVVTTNSSTVTLAIASGSGTLLGTASANAVAGVATFNALAIDVADSYTLSASDVGLAGDTSGSFTLVAGAATQLVMGTQPTDTVAGHTISNIVVDVEDQYGNVVTTDTSAVTIAINTGTGTISGTTTVNATAGVATFNDLSMVVTGGKTFTLTDANVNLTPATTASRNITPDSANHLTILTGPTSGSAGALNTITVAVEDEFGNVVDTDSSTVGIAMNTGGGTLLGTATVPANNGIATFSALSIHTPGTFTLSATDGSLTGDITGSFTITPAAASQVVFTTQPGDISAGALGTVVAKVEDAYGNVVTTDSSTVSLTISGTGSLLGTTTAQAVNGVATFGAVTIHTAGTFTLGAADGSLTGGTSSSFTVSPTAATHLAFTSGPNSMVAGNLLSGITVSIEDQYNNVVTSSNASVTFNVTGGGSTFNFVIAAVNGVSTLSSIYLVKAGSYGVKATSTGLTGAGSNVITVTPDVPALIAITAGPTSTVAGQTISSVIVAVEDQFNNLETSDTSAVTLNVTGGTASLAGTTTVNAIGGIATFSDLAIAKTGSYTLSAADGILLSATSGSFNITPAAASQLAITTQPTDTTAGGTISNIVVKVEDRYGNVVTNDASSVTAALGTGTGTIAGTTTVSAVAGVATFSDLSMAVAGSKTLSLTDTGLASANTNSFTIAPAGAHKVVFTTGPASGEAGALNTVIASVEDTYGNVVTTDTSEVDLAIGLGSGTLLGTATANAVAGVATFNNLAIHVPDTYTLTASDGSLTGDTSGSFNITPATATHLVITTQPTSTVAGLTLSDIVVKVEDQYNNVVTSDTSSVAITVSTGTGTMAGTTTVNAVAGVATFNDLVMGVAGTKVFSLSDIGLTGDTTGSITISPAGANKLAYNIAPATTTAGVVMGGITVAVEDQFGNVVTGDNSNVTIAIASGPGTFVAGTTTKPASGGIAAFGDLQINTAGGYTLAVSDGSLNAATSGSFSITPAIASKVVFTTAPAGGTAGNLNTVIARVEDQFNNVVTTNSSTVTLAVASGSGSLLGTTSVAAVAGVATFSNLAIHVADSYTLAASDTGLTGDTSGSFTLVAGAASHLAFTQQPGDAVAGTQLSTIKVSVEDQYGNVVTTDTSNINLTLNSGGNSVSLQVAASSGVATFSGIALLHTGTFSLQALDGSLTSATSNSFTIAAGAPSQLVFTTGPMGGAAGAIANIGVSIEDQYGNVVITNSTATVSISVATGAGSILGATVQQFSNGVATFSNMGITVPDTYTLDVTSGGVTAATSSSFTITPAAPSQLVITTGPADAVAGTTMSGVVVKVEDQWGNVVTNDSSNVTIGIATGASSLGGTKTVAAVNGVATFSSLSINTAGSYTLDVSELGLTGATSSSFNITPAAASQLVISTPTTTVAGHTISNVVATFEDAFGNTVTGDNANVTIAIASGPGTLGGTTTVSAVNGIATFGTLAIAKSGSYTLDASAAGVTGATTGSFTITADVATHLAFGTQPAGGAAGTLASFTVDALDQYGNIATGDSSTVSLAASGPGSLFGTATANAVAGVATFNAAALHAAGGYTLSATDGSLAADTSGSFTITAAAAAKLSINGPGDTIAGHQLDMVAVKIEDQYGNVVTSDNSNVTIGLASGPQATLGGTTTVPASGGLALFTDLSMTKAGDFTLNVTDGVLAGDTSGSFTVMHAGAAKLEVTLSPTDTVAGHTISAVTVAVEDQYGNLDTDDASTVTVALASGTANLSGNLTAIASSGVATFNTLSITKAGMYTLGVTDSSLTPGTSGSFNITSDAANHLLITGEPGNAVAGQTISTVTVAVEDQYGNVVTNATSNVSIVLTNDAVVLHGTSSVAPFNGVATFSDLSINNAGNNYVLRATDAGLTPDNSTGFNVIHSTASKLIITQGPTATVAGQIVSDVIVQVEDQFGNVVTDDASSVSLALGTNAATLNGTTTVTAASGIATFNTLNITRTGSYTLHATDGNLTADTSGSFNITPAAEAQLVVSNATTAAAGDVLSPVTVTAFDTYGNVVTDLSGNVTLSGTIPTIAGTLSQPYVNGVATFDDLSITGAGTYSFTAADDNLSIDVTNGLTITPAAPAQLVIATGPGDNVAGQTLSGIVVDVEDQYGNIVTNDSSSVSIAIVTGAGSLGGTTTVTAVNGVASFSDLSITTADDYAFDITDSDPDALTDASTGTITISPAAPSQLVILTQPGTQAGKDLSEMTVAVEDQYGNIVTNDSSNVTISIATGSASLGGTLTEAAVNGVATFDDLSISKNGNYTLRAADPGLTPDTSDSFTIGAKLVFQKQPATTVAGQTIGPVIKVMIEDANGHLLSGENSTVTLSLASGSGTLLGTTSVDAVAGIATFNDLAINESGAFKLMASNDGFNDATSVSFNIAPAAPTQMAVLQDAPGTVVAGVKIGPAISVQLLDGFNNLAVNNHATITATILSGPDGAKLGGTVKATVNNGIATFGNLVLTTAGTYQLQLSGAGLQATTVSFNVTAAAARKLAFVQQPTTAAVNTNLSPAVTVAVEDAFGNLISNSTASVTLAVQTGPGGSMTPVTVTAVNGIATFNAVKFTKKGTYKLKATSLHLTLGGSAAVVITPAIG